jgi:glycosyltransferase involved in cell wall biosynthesis
MNRLSACIITLNEERNLPRLLESLRGIADEIVVVDSGSTDRTETIARKHGARFEFRKWTHYGEQKNHAAAIATSEWILSLDADEALSSALQSALLNWKKGIPQFDVYEMARKTWYLGGWVKHSGWYPDSKKRLYRKGVVEFSGSLHESLQYDGKCGRLTGDLLHYTVESFAEHEAKTEKYSTLAARKMFDEGRRSWRAAMWFGAPWTFLQSFIIRAGFLDGRRGVLIAQMAARSVRSKFRMLGILVREERLNKTR